MCQHQMPPRTGQASSDLHTTIRGVAGELQFFRGSGDWSSKWSVLTRQLGRLPVEQPTRLGIQTKYDGGGRWPPSFRRHRVICNLPSDSILSF